LDASLIAFLKCHAKAMGIGGDSLTLLGSISLAIDALFKKQEQIQLAAQKLIKKDFGAAAQGEDGGHLDPKNLEEEAIDKSVRFAKLGACLLLAGFVLLLLTRIVAE
jgi:hypothetical protein